MGEYLGEFRANPRPLIGAALGLGSGLGSVHFLANVFVPKLIGEFGWARADFALVASVGVLVFLFLPVWGRLADVFGVRRIAIWGVLCQPLCYVGFSLMTGDIRQYLVIQILLLFGGCATTVAVYGRIIMERYVRARGLALAIAVSTAPLIGAIGAPILNAVIDAYGWRAGYRVLAVVLGLLGLLAIALVPRDTATLRAKRNDGGSFRDYPVFVRAPAFLIIVVAMVLTNLSQILNGSQLGLLLSDKGASPATAAEILSIYGIGVVVGRFFCGLALDRFPPHLVAAVVMVMPGIGLLLLAANLAGVAWLIAALLLIGLMTGAEGDISSYLVMKYFPTTIYGSVNGLVSAAGGAAMGGGGLILSLTFRVTPSFDLFLVIGAAAVFVGASLFLLLGRCRPLREDEVETARSARLPAPAPFPSPSQQGS